jgi:uncharacterized membrane protein YheB (UPF0754 family)
MSYLPPEIYPYIKYAAPPVIGAVIGYVTNKVAIKMLFRPLKAWKFGGIRVPMTPGVIPSRRLYLAQNMGEVVGDHLLTSKEISKGLRQDIFQDKLLSLIEERIKEVLEKNLDTLPSLIPAQFRVYFDLARKTIIYQVKENLHSFVNSEQFTFIVASAIESRIEEFLDHELGTVLSSYSRENFYTFIEKNMQRMLASPEMEQWVEDFVHQKVHTVLLEEKTIADLLPESLQALILASLEKQTPPLLKKLSTIVSEPDVRDKIVNGACAGVDNFIDSLGSMADMARGFLNMDSVEEKIREYLVDKNDDIVTWLQSEKVQAKVITGLKERSSDFLHKPIATYVRADDETVIEDFCTQLTKQILSLVGDGEVTSTLTQMIKSNIENYIDSGDIRIRVAVSELLGKKEVGRGKLWLKSEIVSLIKSDQTLLALDAMVESMAESLLTRKIGRLANIIPVGVREGGARSLKRLASAMLETGVPSLVRTLNIRKIVTEKINSLDLLRLERLLLSIMEEQFKYINLFGALLGFLIGCLNLLFLYGM